MEHSKEPGFCLLVSVPQLEGSEVAGDKVAQAWSALVWSLDWVDWRATIFMWPLLATGFPYSMAPSRHQWEGSGMTFESQVTEVSLDKRTLTIKAPRNPYTGPTSYWEDPQDRGVWDEGWWVALLPSRKTHLLRR